MDRKNLVEIKKQWIKHEFIGGAIICDFLMMKENGLDIVYNEKNALVQEYVALLKQRLKTNNFNLVLMTNVEIEKCIIDKEEEIYAYLSDEIYEHFKNNGNEYPVEAVGLHIDIIMALVYLSEKEKVYNYLHTIKEIYKETFGDKNYLFCRNWSYILNEVLLELIPEVAIEEFDENLNLFASVLREDIILYRLCINIAARKTNQDKDIGYIKESIELCKIWCNDIPAEKRKGIQGLVYAMTAMYYRNIGKYDEAINTFLIVFELADDIHSKLFSLAQIATVLYMKHDWKKMGDFFEKYKTLIMTLQEPEENVAELYNLLGLYYMQIGDYYEAQIQIERAIEISKKIWGEEGDTTIKFKSNRLIVKYNVGEFGEAKKGMQELLDILSKNVEQHPESISFVFNNFIATSFEDSINSSMVLKMKTILDRKYTKYDMASSIMFKCNLYCLMMASGDDYSEDTVNELREELQYHFNQYPYSEGYFEYLKGEFCRLNRKNNFFGYEVLEEIEKYLSEKKVKIISREYISYFIIKLKILIHKKKYIEGRRWLLSLWETILLPLFEKLSSQSEENAKYICMLLRSYISLFISSARQYIQLKITEIELYEYVLNFKYFEDLFYCKKSKLNSMLKKIRWLSIKDLKISKGNLIIECFNYVKYDMENAKIIFSDTSNDLPSSTYQLCFALQFATSLFSKCKVEVLSEISIIEIEEKIKDIFEDEEISQVEEKTWIKLNKYLSKKDRIYVCNDIVTVGMPLAALRINKKQYWGELYQIIYCNTAFDVKEGIEIRDISNSIYFGMSYFKNVKKNEDNKIQKQLVDLPYVESEVKKLGILTGGDVYLDGAISNICFAKQRKEIIHFATHTVEDDGEKALVVGKQKNEQYTLLKSKDIANLDWNGVKLVIFSACETNEEPWESFGRYSFGQAAKKAGALFSITTFSEIYDGSNLFFMVCLYKNILRYKKIIKAFFETQKTVSTITKKEILSDSDYLDIGMEYYLENFDEESVPFRQIDIWAGYILQIN